MSSIPTSPSTRQAAGTRKLRVPRLLPGLILTGAIADIAIALGNIRALQDYGICLLYTSDAADE